MDAERLGQGSLIAPFSPTMNLPRSHLSGLLTGGKALLAAGNILRGAGQNNAITNLGNNHIIIIICPLSSFEGDGKTNGAPIEVK
jgi:hypothetical protein